MAWKIVLDLQILAKEIKWSQIIQQNMQMNNTSIHVIYSSKGYSIKGYILPLNWATPC